MSLRSVILSPVLREDSATTRLIVLGGLAAGILLAAYILLVAVGASYTQRWLIDVMGLVAAAYRVYLGQAPSLDFFSVLGAGVYYPGAMGFALGLDSSVVLAFGQVVVAALLLGAAVIVCYLRCSLIPASVFIIFLALLILAPMSLGSSPFESSLGVYYNRHGWAGLAIVLLSYIETRNASNRTLLFDSVALGVVLLFLILTTLNFAIVAAAFMMANAVISKHGRTLAAALFGCVAAILIVVELLTGYGGAYLSDFMALFSVGSTVVQGSSNIRELISVVLETWPSLMTCLLAFAVFSFDSKRRIWDALYFFGVAAICVVLASQTGSGATGVPALAAVIVCFGELARRNAGSESAMVTISGSAASLGTLTILVLLLVFVSKPLLENTFAIYHYNAQARAVSTSPASPAGVSLAGFRVAAETSRSMHDVIGHGDSEHSMLSALRRATRDQLTADAYMETIVEGVGLIEDRVSRNDAIVVFDAVDPFTAVLGLKPTAYGYPLFWAGAAFSLEHHPEPVEFFADARYAVVPVVPYRQLELDLMMRVYGQYLKDNFVQIANSDHWRLWERTTAAGK